MRFVFPIAYALLALGWLIFLAAGNRIATAIGGRFGSILQRVGKGKISDPIIFTYERERELLLLLTLIAILGLALWALARLVRGLKYRWLYNALAAFIALNILTAAAMNTVLFWGAMFTGSRTANYTQFQFKRALINEQPAPHTALLLGSSQTQAQIDENQLNSLIGTNIWTTELHFPGSAWYDVLMVYEQLRDRRADFLIIYVSEGYFFNGLRVEAPPFFARLEQIPLADFLGLGNEVFSRPFRYGYFAQLIPLLRAREAFSHRLFGPDIALLNQATHDVGLESDLAHRAESVAKLFKDDAYVEFQRRAFEEFVRRASADGRKIILFEGQLNPVLSERITRSLRDKMRGFLHAVAARNPNVDLVSDSKLPPQSASDYQDLTHVRPAAQQKFTQWLAAYLQAKVP